MSAQPVEIKQLRAAVADALQSAWDDFVGDTGCFPDCFSLLNARSNTQMTADFGKGNFARMVADWLLPHLQDTTPLGTDEVLRRWYEDILPAADSATSDRGATP